MKRTEKDYEYLETSPELLARGLRRITRPKFLDNISTNLRDCKSRITIYLDADIVAKFREMGENENTGYQTLINRELRKVVDEMDAIEAQALIKEELLNDEQFIDRLKEKLAA
jgi:uncharacterized protein (DUF4415 family)